MHVLVSDSVGHFVIVEADGGQHLAGRGKRWKYLCATPLPTQNGFIRVQHCPQATYTRHLTEGEVAVGCRVGHHVVVWRSWIDARRVVSASGSHALAAVRPIFDERYKNPGLKKKAKAFIRGLALWTLVYGRDLRDVSYGLTPVIESLWEIIGIMSCDDQRLDTFDYWIGRAMWNAYHIKDKMELDLCVADMYTLHLIGEPSRDITAACVVHMMASLSFQCVLCDVLRSLGIDPGEDFPLPER
jgi:hypothetical protein